MTRTGPTPAVGVDVSPREQPTGPDFTTDAVEGTSVSGGPIGPALGLDAVVDLASNTEPIGSTLTPDVLDSSAASDKPIGVGESAATTDPMSSALTLDVVDNFAASGDPIKVIPLPATRVETPIVDETIAVGNGSHPSRILWIAIAIWSKRCGSKLGGVIDYDKNSVLLPSRPLLL
uniref:Uncharacterized protein n=1 Tax=Peronospora matthiolae TaxID=2874970 RepID=A0AAV1UYQ6_9STRA